LKQQLHKQYPNIANTKRVPDEVRAKQAEGLPEMWEEIPEAFFEKLWNSMPDHIAAVIDAKGWYSR
jgi:hypothetical protein